MEARAQATDPESGAAGLDAHSAEARYAGRIGKHAFIYGIAAFMTVISGLVTVAVYTRFIDPTAFGKFAVLGTTASFVTVAVNLCSLQGTMRRVHGVGGEEEAGEDEFDEEATSGDPRLALTTGLVLTGFVGTVVFMLALVFRRQLSSLFFGTTADSGLLLLAVGAGAAAGLMRLARNILRLQLRSVAYLVVSTVFALGSTLVAIPLLAEGLGVSAILIGAIAANVTSGAIAVLYLRRDVRAAVSLREAKEIMRSGVGYLPIVLSFQVLQLADTYLVAGFADLSSAGLYSVAKKVTQPVTYGTSVFQQAWGPMSHDLTHAAVDRKNEDFTITARLVTYYTVFVFMLILGVALFADQIVRLASPEYQSASILVPVTALSIAGHGGFVLAYRISRLSNKFYWINLLSTITAPIFLGIGTFLIIPFGAIGAPIAAVCAWGLATAAMVLVGHSQAQDVPFENLKLIEIALSAIAAWLLGYYVLPDSALGVLGKAALFLGWAALIVWRGIVPMDSLRSFYRFARHALGVETKRQFRRGLAKLEGRDAALVEEVVRQKVPVEEVAGRHDLDEQEILALTIQALRTAAIGGGEPKPTDGELGSIILVQRPAAARGHLLMALVREGLDPIETDLIVRTAGAARASRLSVRRRRWSR